MTMDWVGDYDQAHMVQVLSKARAALKQWEADYIRDKIYQSAKETHTDGRKLL